MLVNLVSLIFLLIGNTGIISNNKLGEGDIKILRTQAGGMMPVINPS